MRLLLTFIGIIVLLGGLASAADRFVDGKRGNDLKPKGQPQALGANDCLDKNTPCKTITQAIKRSRSGDRIHVRSETYKDEEEFPLPVVWRLEIIPWEPDKPKPVIETGQAKAAIEIREGADKSIIQGFYIKFSPVEAASAAIAVQGASFVRLERLTVDLKEKGGTGILLRESRFSEIIENTVLGKGGQEDKEHDGIRLEGGANNTLSGNQVSNNDGAGIFVGESQGNRLLGNTAVGNFFGIALLESSGNELVDNEVISNTLGGIGLACLSISCDGNKLLNNRASSTQQLSGIMLVGKFGDTSLKGNVTSLNAKAGIELAGDFRNALISDNTAENNCQFGFSIEFQGPERNTLSDNVANDNSEEADVGIALVPFKPDEKYVDDNANGVYDVEESIYRDKDNSGTVTAGDEKLLGPDKPVDTPLKPFILERHAENVKKNGLYDSGEFIYRDIDGDSKVSKGDFRLMAACIPGSIKGKGESGIGIFFTGSNSTLSDNTVNANGKLGIEVSGSKNTLSNNIVNSNEEAGIALTQGAEKNMLLNNTAISNGIGISLKGSNNNKLLKNTVKNNRCNGIELNNSSQNEIWNNAVTLNVKDCPAPDKKLLGGGIALIGNSSSNKISGNVIQENFNGISIRVSFVPSEEKKANSFVCNSILRNEKNGIQLLNQANSNVLHKNNIEDNQGSGVRNFTDQPVDARHNWWSHPSGPNHSSNPAGKGDKILGPAIYAPWLQNPVNLKGCS